jgi:hypothetical protein
MQAMIGQALELRGAEPVTSLVEEVTQHVRFCHEKCRNFCGRKDALDVIFLTEIKYVDNNKQYLKKKLNCARILSCYLPLLYVAGAS